MIVDHDPAGGDDRIEAEPDVTARGWGREALTPEDARTVTLALLDARATGATVCPSKVARVLAGDGADWRDAMPVVHAAVDAMVADGLVRLSWKGVAMAVRAGPYRIGWGEGER